MSAVPWYKYSTWKTCSKETQDERGQT